MSTPEPPPGRFGCGAIAMIVIGLLILIPSGLCTSLFAIGSLASMFVSPANFDIAATLPALVLGLPFVALGAFLVHLGWRRPRR